jgi:hypothetical protein
MWVAGGKKEIPLAMCLELLGTCREIESLTGKRRGKICRGASQRDESG